MYAKQYAGFVTGSPGGRDDGYPEIKTIFFKDLAELARDPERPEEIIYEMVECGPKIYRKITDERHAQEQQALNEQREKDEQLFENLRKKLGK